MIVCTSCGKENEDFFLFCISCGATLEGAEETVFEPLPAEKTAAVFDGLPTSETPDTPLLSDAFNEPPHATEESKNLPDAPSEEPGIITFADFEASEPALTIPTTRPFNKSLMNTVVTEVVFAEDVDPVSHEDESQNIEVETQLSTMGAALDNADMPEVAPQTPSTDEKKELDLPFLAPFDAETVAVNSVLEEPRVELPLRAAPEPSEPEPAEPTLENALSESANISERVLMDTQPDVPPSETAHVSAPSALADTDVPDIVSIDWTDTVEKVSTQPEMKRVVQSESTAEGALPPESAQPSKEPKKPKKRLRASKPKKRARSTGRRQRPGLCGKIVLLNQDGSEGDRFDLFTDSTWLGSNKGDINFGDDQCMAPKHAVLFYEGGTLKVRSLDKRNGVFLRLADRTSTPLNSGDQFRIGQELLQYKALEPNQRQIRPSKDGTVPLGSPLSRETWGFLYQRLSETEHGNVFVLDQECVAMGRDEGDITFPDDRTVSGVHAEISHSDGSVFLQDVGSSNGTYLRLTGTTDLAVGDHLLIGEQILRIVN